MANALAEWPNGGMKFPKQDIRSPHDFEQMAKLVRPEDFAGRMLISSDLEAHRREIQKFINLGFDRVYLHNVGRNQREWAEAFGREVLPKILWGSSSGQERGWGRGRGERGGEWTEGGREGGVGRNIVNRGERWGAR